MPNRPIIILLSNRRVAAARLERDGSIGVWAERRIELSSGQNWSCQLDRCKEPLNAVLAELGPRSRPWTRVLYESPDAATELVMAPAGPGEAMEAARLVLADIAGFDLDENVTGFSVAAREHGRTHVLATADLRQNVEAVSALIARCGVRPNEVCPLEAALIGGLTAQSDGDLTGELRLHLHLGEESTVLLFRRGESIEMVRVIDLGLEQLIEALASTLPVEEDEGSSRDARHAEAARLLFERGLRQDGDPEERLPREALVALQPVIQRYIVELKQTIRFGPEETRGQAPQVVTHGPGSRVPQFIASLSRALNIEVHESGAIGDSAEPRVADLLCMSLSDSLPRLTTPESRRRAELRRFRACAAAGAMCAVMLLGIQGFASNRALAGVRAAAARDASLISAAKARIEEETRVRASERTAANALASLRTALGDAPWLSAILVDLAGAATPETRLLDVRLTSPATGPMLSVEGVITESNERRAGDELRRFVGRIESSAQTPSVRIGSTRATRIDGEAGQRFTLEIMLTTAPALAIEEARP